MKTWIKRSLIGIFGAALLVGGLSACNHSRHEHGVAMSAVDQAQMRGKLIERVGSKLELNAEQKQRLSVLADTLQAQRAALVGAAADPRAEIHALVAGETFDRTGAQLLITAKTAAITSKSPAVVAAMADFFDGLNATQQAQVRDFMQGRRSWWSRH